MPKPKTSQIQTHHGSPIPVPPYIRGALQLSSAKQLRNGKQAWKQKKERRKIRRDTYKDTRPR